MRLEEKVGLFTSDTAILEFEGCRVPASNMLGSRGKGFRVAYSGLLDGRLAIAAGCVGIMRDCLRASVERATTRVQYGKQIGKHQVIQRYIAELAMNVEMAAWVTYMAAVTRMQYAKNFDDKQLLAKADLQATMAKRIASMLACKSSDTALQLFGGFGYSTLSPPGRHFLDSRVTRIYEGTDEILDLKIASMILGEGYESYR
jgi:alkylation response protein AidB-like acyl-CoA dehydrogenase